MKDVSVDSGSGDGSSEIDGISVVSGDSASVFVSSVSCVGKVVDGVFTVVVSGDGDWEGGGDISSILIPSVVVGDGDVDPGVDGEVVASTVVVEEEVVASTVVVEGVVVASKVVLAVPVVGSLVVTDCVTDNGVDDVSSVVDEVLLVTGTVVVQVVLSVGNSPSVLLGCCSCCVDGGSQTADVDEGIVVWPRSLFPLNVDPVEGPLLVNSVVVDVGPVELPSRAGPQHEPK